MTLGPEQLVLLFCGPLKDKLIIFIRYGTAALLLGPVSRSLVDKISRFVIWSMGYDLIQCHTTHKVRSFILIIFNDDHFIHNQADLLETYRLEMCRTITGRASRYISAHALNRLTGPVPQGVAMTATRISPLKQRLQTNSMKCTQWESNHRWKVGRRGRLRRKHPNHNSNQCSLKVNQLLTTPLKVLIKFFCFACDHYQTL